MSIRVEVTIKDTMAFWNDHIESHVFNPNGYCPTNVWVYEVPDDWVSGSELNETGLEGVCAHLYGPTWRAGNDDGSKYVVLEATSRNVPEGDGRPAKVIGASR